MLNKWEVNTIMDALTKGIQDEEPWCMLFMDELALISETPDEINDKLEW